MIDLSLSELFGAPMALDDASVRVRRARFATFDAAPERSKRAKGDKALRPVRPNAGIRAAYHKQLIALIRAMARDVRKTVMAEYRDTPPKMIEAREDAKEAAADGFAQDGFAQDDFASSVLRAAFKRLVAKWYKRFDGAASELAEYFATKSSERVDGSLERILREGGWSIKFEMTSAQKDVIGAIVNENVALIKSIPQQYLGEVEQMVMRSVAAGRNIKQLSDDLQKRLGVTERRANFIALDQSNKATALLNRARNLESGLEWGVWMHSGAGIAPRPTHVKAGRDKQVFSIDKGWPDPALRGKRIWPSTEPNCRCSWRPILPIPSQLAQYAEQIKALEASE